MIENKFKKYGYFNTKVTINTLADSTNTKVDMVVFIDKGEKVKVKSIEFEGNSKMTDASLKKTFKNTKQRNPIRILKKSKYNFLKR